MTRQIISICFIVKCTFNDHIFFNILCDIYIYILYNVPNWKIPSRKNEKTEIEYNFIFIKILCEKQ